MQNQQQGEGRRHPSRTPAGWPGLSAATSAATRRAVQHRAHRSGPRADPRLLERPSAATDAAPEAVEVHIRVLDRMVSLLTVLVESQERGGALDPDALGLASLMTADLDRHLTDLMDAQYEPADDVRVIAIEQALATMRTRLGEFAPPR